MLVENHEIANDPLHSPVVMNLEKLPHARQSICGRERCEKNRPVTRDAETPKFRLTELVVCRLRAQTLELGMRI